MSEHSIHKILELMPHRYPMLLVDKVIEFNEQEIHCVKNVTINEPFFNGHFPSEPVMPGVLMLEGMAQAAGLLYYLNRNTCDNQRVHHFLASIDKARFKRIVVPGDQLHYHAALTNKRKSFLKLACETRVEDSIACSAEILIAQKEESA